MKACHHQSNLRWSSNSVGFLIFRKHRAEALLKCICYHNFQELHPDLTVKRFKQLLLLLSVKVNVEGEKLRPLKV